MKPLEQLLPRVLTRATGCPEPVAIDALISAAIEFCERTRLWRDSDEFDVTQAMDCEHVAAPYGAVLYEIESARFDGEPLDPISISELDRKRKHWRTDTGDHARYITQVLPNTVRIYPKVAGTVELSTILKPSFEAKSLPDFMVLNHARTLADGALGEILSIPGQKFTNNELSAYHSGRFEQKLNELTGSNIKGQHRAPTRTVPQFF